MILTFAKVPPAKGCECQNRTTRCQSTHRDALTTVLRWDHSSNEWEFGSPGVNGENAGNFSALSPLTQGFAEIWPGPSLVNAGLVCVDLRPRRGSPSGLFHELRGRSEKRSDPRVYQCPRNKAEPPPARPACRRFHHFDRLFSLPMRRDWASVAPLKAAPAAIWL